MEPNTSGQGPRAVMPAELRGWNWGAFLLNWIWGIGNGTFIALLMFVPLVNFVMPFVLGAKGNEWAWRNRTWRDVDHFRSTQRKWGWWGLAIVVIVIPSCIAIPFASLRNSEAFTMSLAQVRQSAEVVAQLGEPISPGMLVMGNIEVDPAGGKATLHYSVSGPKAAGDVAVEAEKHAGKWQLEKLEVDLPSTSQHLVLVPSN